MHGESEAPETAYVVQQWSSIAGRTLKATTELLNQSPFKSGLLHTLECTPFTYS